ncbi:MAG: hypothetical protein LBP53_05205 [Candidatus Peribacteria bacterium]|jgi:hypothetical protein|nr:hypothetical protein [Candidatus Peribacteria bacterium]
MSDKQAEAVRNKAKELGDSLNTLRAQETTFKAIKQQLEDMLKNIDKNRLTSNDEMKLKSALEQVNFILEGI